eukprot:m.22062 g.22062  ORF g.22062 m.22062 type:complete len:679 (+) comp28277_c1_seq2:255-2291(+)
MSCKTLKLRQFISRRFSGRLLTAICFFIGIVLLTVATTNVNVERAGSMPPSMPYGSSSQASHAGVFTGRRPLSTASNSTPSTNTSTNTSTSEKTKQYWPEDIFDMATRRQGAVLLHVAGVIYMFVALAIVCDEFFVPALNVIAIKLNLSKDVAGATFMAAGGSTPELFTSFFGVFVANTNVGFGTIVGSAVFNVLFVIGMCAVVSKQVLHLSWWPLFRDCSFYCVALLVLMLFYMDFYIAWYEAFVLFTLYLVYVTFMKFNQHIEEWVKSKLSPNAVRPITVNSGQDSEANSRPDTASHGVGFHGVVRQGAVHVLLHAMLLHPMYKGSDSRNASKKSVRDEKDKSKEQEAPVVGFGLVPPGTTPSPRSSIDRSFLSEHLDMEFTPSPSESSSARQSVSTKKESDVSGYESTRTTKSISVVKSRLPLPGEAPSKAELDYYTVPDVRIQCSSSEREKKGNGTDDGEESDEKEIEDDDEPLSIKWPESWRKRITYVLLIPIVYPLYFTLPDVRNKEKRKWYVWAFIGSMLWIGIYSYFMVWWANQIGDTIGISPEVMGLTFLAAGTSIPDLITSVIVARQGCGDMAVSSSIGSNLFDVTVGLPLPWFFAAVIRGHAIEVFSNGLFCSVALLFGMIIILVVTIIVCKWKMNRPLGAVMFTFYAIFLTISILLETKTIGKCLI